MKLIDVCEMASAGGMKQGVFSLELDWLQYRLVIQGQVVSITTGSCEARPFVCVCRYVAGKYKWPGANFKVRILSVLPKKLLLLIMFSDVAVCGSSCVCVCVY